MTTKGDSYELQASGKWQADFNTLPSGGSFNKNTPWCPDVLNVLNVQLNNVLLLKF